MYYVYVLLSQISGKRYVGFTSDLKKRATEHNGGSTYSTKPGIPWKLIYYEAYVEKMDAVERERFLKSGWGKRYLKKTLTHYFSKK